MYSEEQQHWYVSFNKNWENDNYEAFHVNSSDYFKVFNPCIQIFPTFCQVTDILEIVIP